MVNFGKPESIDLELTLEELRLIGVALILVGQIMSSDLQSMPETIMMIKLGYSLGVYQLETVQSVAGKLKDII